MLVAGKTFAQEDCDLRKDTDSIRVYSCKALNSSFKSIKAEAFFNSTLDQFVAAMLDIEKYVDWQYNTIQAYVLEKISEDELIYYSEVEAPWPASNRDSVIRLKLKREPENGILHFTTHSMPDYFPKKEDDVRVPMSEAHWIVTQIGENKLRLDYKLQIDPGGSVPAWLVNMASAEAPYASFRDLRKKLRKQQ